MIKNIELIEIVNGNSKNFYFLFLLYFYLFLFHFEGFLGGQSCEVVILGNKHKIDLT